MKTTPLDRKQSGIQAKADYLLQKLSPSAAGLDRAQYRPSLGYLTLFDLAGLAEITRQNGWAGDWAKVAEDQNTRAKQKMAVQMNGHLKKRAFTYSSSAPNNTPHYAQATEGDPKESHCGATIRNRLPGGKERPAGKAVGASLNGNFDGSAQTANVPDLGTKLWVVVGCQEVTIAARAKIDDCAGAIERKYRGSQSAKIIQRTCNRVGLTACRDNRGTTEGQGNQRVDIICSVLVAACHAGIDEAQLVGVMNGQGSRERRRAETRNRR